MKHGDGKDTKSKILDVANELFARNGYDGTSIREIATKADVNIAAINYHFKNKENLFRHLFDLNYQWMDEEIEKIGKDTGLSTGDFSYQMYMHFLENGPALINNFKLILTDTLSLSTCDQDNDPNWGPPGGQALFKVITRDIGEEVPEEARYWAMRMIFSEIVHFGLVMSTSYMKTKCESVPFLSPENKKRDIQFLVEAILNYAKTHSNNWK
jgi:AcrR family transcriptional regulator